MGLVLLISISACAKRSLRGHSLPSKDGRTYLVIDELNGSACVRPLLDGRPWPHPVGVPGSVSPGKHRITCGGEIEFVIEPRTTFHFDYWGP